MTAPFGVLIDALQTIATGRVEAGQARDVARGAIKDFEGATGTVRRVWGRARPQGGVTLLMYPATGYKPYLLIALKDEQ